jgi:hypothetical protein
MNIIFLYIISIIHLAFIFFVIGTPFLTNINAFLLLHSVVVPFMMGHWLTNNNMCTLTAIEKYIRIQVYGPMANDKLDNCFTCRLIEPVYDFDKNFDKFQKILYMITIFLWSVSVYKLYCNHKNGRLNSFNDLFIV